MEIYQLRGFVAVAEQGNLTRAAERLHVSQPALSAQIRALEEELRVALFERVPSGMTLTPAGRHVLPAVQAVLAAANAVRAEARKFAGEVSGTVRVGTVSDPEFIRLPHFLACGVDRYPLLEIELHHEVSGIAFEKVREDELDAAFYYGDLAHPDVASAALCEFAFRVVAPIAWRDRVEGAPFAELAREPWIMTPHVSTHRVLSDRLFRQHGVQPATVIEADNETLIRSLVSAGLGLALMRDDLAQSLAVSGEVCLWSDVHLATTLQFVWRRQRNRDPVILALLDMIHEAWPHARVPEVAADQPA